MTEATVESIFGTKAGIVWKALNKNGPSNIDNIVKARKETKVKDEILRY
jgi:hypothetical protein